MNEEVYREVQFAVYGQTVLHPIVLIATIILCIIALTGKRQTLVYLFIFQSLFITIAQRYVIADLDLSIVRILSIVTLLRVLIRSEIKTLQIYQIDKLMIAWFAIGIIMPVLLYRDLNVSLRVLVNVFEWFCMYFVWRISVQNLSEFISVLKFLAVLIIPVAIFMINEQISGKNLFSVFGGVPELTFQRDGRLRSQAAFGHPISAGTFGATFLPLFIGLLIYANQYKKRTYVAIVCCLIMVFTAASSGPILSLIAAIFGMALWPFRRYIKFIVWSVIGCLFGLHLVMEAPVWFLIARASVVSGSTAYHRAALIDAAIKRFPEWWLLGTKQTGHWGWGFQDVTNMYIRQAVGGGLLKFALFCAIIILCFKALGNKIRGLEEKPQLELFVWMLGVCLFTHCVSILGVNYFDQMLFFWLGTIGVITALCTGCTGDQS